MFGIGEKYCVWCKNKGKMVWEIWGHCLHWTGQSTSLPRLSQANWENTLAHRRVFADVIFIHFFIAYPSLLEQIIFNFNFPTNYPFIFFPLYLRPRTVPSFLHSPSLFLFFNALSFLLFFYLVTFKKFFHYLSLSLLFLLL